MLSSELTYLLRRIDSERPVDLTRDNLFDPPGKLYTIIHTLYQGFKKEHEFELLRDKVYNISIDSPSLHYQTISRRYTPVTAAGLCSQHELKYQYIHKLISIKYYLYGARKRYLIEYIINQICKLTRVEDVLRCFKKVLRSVECVYDVKLYALAQQKMVVKVLTMELRGGQFRSVGETILALPYIGSYMLGFISRLYEKTQTLDEFTFLYFIFINNFPAYPNKIDLYSLVRICTPYTLLKLGKLMVVLPYMSQIIYAYAVSKLSTMYTTITDKVQAILDFIVLTIQTGSSVWYSIILWYQRAEQDCIYLLKTKLEAIVNHMLQEKACFGTVLTIVSRLSMVYTHSEIGQVLVKLLMRLNNPKYLNNRQVRQFLACRILKASTAYESIYLVLGTDLRFVEVVCEMFTFGDKCVRFFRNITMNEGLLKDFLNSLGNNYPVKLKEILIKIDQTVKGDILNTTNNFYLTYLAEISFELTVSIVRDMALYQPSKFVAAIFGKFLQTYRDHKNYNVLKTHVFRSLNLMLIRTPTKELNDHFKSYLPKLIHDHVSVYQQKIIFADVSNETKDELKRAFYYATKKR